MAVGVHALRAVCVRARACVCVRVTLTLRWRVQTSCKLQGNKKWNSLCVPGVAPTEGRLGLSPSVATSVYSIPPILVRAVSSRPATHSPHTHRRAK